MIHLFFPPCLSISTFYFLSSHLHSLTFPLTSVFIPFPTLLFAPSLSPFSLYFTVIPFLTLLLFQFFPLVTFLTFTFYRFLSFPLRSFLLFSFSSSPLFYILSSPWFCLYLAIYSSMSEPYSEFHNSLRSLSCSVLPVFPSPIISFPFLSAHCIYVAFNNLTSFHSIHSIHFLSLLTMPPHFPFQTLFTPKFLLITIYSRRFLEV